MGVVKLITPQCEIPEILMAGNSKYALELWQPSIAQPAHLVSM